MMLDEIQSISEAKRFPYFLSKVYSSGGNIATSDEIVLVLGNTSDRQSFTEVICTKRCKAANPEHLNGQASIAEFPTGKMALVCRPKPGAERLCVRRFLSSRQS